MANEKRSELSRRSLIQGTAAAAGLAMAGLGERPVQAAQTRARRPALAPVKNADFYDAQKKFLTDKGGLDPSEYALPISSLVLPEQPHRRIPGTVAAIQQPAPVGNEGDRDPDGNSQSPGQVGDGRITGDHQVQIHQHGGRVHEVFQTAAQVRDRKPVGNLCNCSTPAPFAGSEAGLRHGGPSGSKQLERNRAITIVDGFVGLPRQAMPILKPASRPVPAASVLPGPGRRKVRDRCGYVPRDRVEDAGQAQQRSLDVESRQFLSLSHQPIDARATSQERQERPLGIRRSRLHLAV
jgi:hypothetical protein